MTFYALASPINIDENDKIHNIWNELDFACEMNQVKFAPIPHFSYMTYKSVNNPIGLQQTMLDLGNEISPFEIQISGLGIFQGPSPILYLPIVKTKFLFDIHSKILGSISPYIAEASDFYKENNWIPHITLAIRDINLDNLSCAVDRCMQFDLSFRLKIDHLAILYMDDETFGINSRFALKASKIPLEETDESLGRNPS